MAGLGETCSHIASVSLTVTQKEAYWVLPTRIKEVPYAPIKSINFIGKSKSHSILASCTSSSSSASPSPSTSTSPSPVGPSPLPSPVASPTHHPGALNPPSCDELNVFFSSLASVSSSKPALLSLIEPYSSKYVPRSLDEDLPMCLSNLFKPENLTCSYGELLQLVKEFDITVTPNQIEAVESKTRLQSKSSLWFRMRCGRITASKFRAVCHTDESSPSVSLIMSICHPNLPVWQQHGVASMKN